MNAFGIRMNKTVPHIRSVEKSFGWDTSHQKASAAEFGLLLDEGSFQSVLAGAYRSGVAAGTTPNHYQVVRHYICILAKVSVKPIISSIPMHSRPTPSRAGKYPVVGCRASNIWS